MQSFTRLALLAVVVFVLHFAAVAQSNSLGPLQQLAGFNYKEKVENAASETKNLPLIIALHWSSSTPDEFAPFVSGFAKPVRILLLEGPYSHPRSGFSFFVRSPKNYYEDLTADEKMANLMQEGEKLSKFIEAAVARYSPKRKPVIIGASQGGDLSYVTAIRYGSIVSAVFPLLATVDERIIRDKATRKKPAPIYSYHGTDDPIVPISTAEQHIKVLKTAGYKAELHFYKGIKHDIPDVMKTDYVKQISLILF